MAVPCMFSTAMLPASATMHLGAPGLIQPVLIQHLGVKQCNQLPHVNSAFNPTWCIQLGPFSFHALACTKRHTHLYPRPSLIAVETVLTKLGSCYPKRTTC